MRGRAAKGNVTSAVSHKGGAHGVRARGMSVSQVIAASGRPLNRGSHLSGDTCHMMPRSLAPRAAYAGPHRTGVRPVRSLRGPSLVFEGPPAVDLLPDRRPSATVPDSRPDRADGFRPSGCEPWVGCLGPPPKPRLRGRGEGHVPGRRGGVSAGAGAAPRRRRPWSRGSAREGTTDRRRAGPVLAGTGPSRGTRGRPGAGPGRRPGRRSRERRVRRPAAPGRAR